MTLQELQALRTANPSREERIDIRDVRIDMDAPVTVRAEQYLEQIKNPYAFMCGDVAVNIEFAPDGKSLNDAMVSYLKAKRS